MGTITNKNHYMKPHKILLILNYLLEFGKLLALVVFVLFVLVDHLVNNAGIGSSFLFEEVSDAAPLNRVMVSKFHVYIVTLASYVYCNPSFMCIIFVVLYNPGFMCHLCHT